MTGMNINFNSYSSVNSSLYTSSSKNNCGNAQYKAVEDKELSDIISEEAIMSPEQKMLYELLVRNFLIEDKLFFEDY